MLKASEVHKPYLVRWQVKDLAVSYDGYLALEIPEMELSGNILAVVGHNGAGKSTLIKTALDLLKPSRGEFILYSPDSNRSLLLPDRDMAFCPETGAVFSDITVREYVKLWCRIKHHDANYYRKGGADVINRLQLEPLLKKRGRELSKGQCRRVQTAIGFLTRPKLFLFDEPFDGLDVQRTNELADIIRDHSRTTAFVISSHRMDVVERLADIVIVLAKGQLHTFGTVSEVCTTLAGTSIRIDEVEDPRAVCEVLADRFKGHVVNQSLGEVVITGTGVTPESVTQVLIAAGFPPVKMHHATPSLVDAVDFHLREIEPAYQS